MPKRFIYLLVVLSLASCRKENDRPQWDIGVLGPVLYANLSLEHLIGDSMTAPGQGGKVNFVIDRLVPLLELDSVYQIPDTTIPTIEQWEFFPVPFPPNSAFLSQNNNVALSISGVQLKKAIIDTGNIHFSVRNTLPTKVNFKYTIPRATKNGNPFSAQLSVDSGSVSDPGLLTTQFDFSGYEIDLTGANGTLFNTLFYNVEARSDSLGDTIFVNTGDTLINIATTLSGIVPTYAEGYLGQADVNESGQELFGLGVHNGNILIDSARMTIDLINYIGADARAYVNSFGALNTHTGNFTGLNAPGFINSALNINRASKTGDPLNPVSPTHYTVVLDNSNSNIKQLIENLPDYFTYNLDMTLNPLGNVSGNNDFIYSDRLTETRFLLEMPFRFAMDQLVITDTLPFTVSDATDFDPVGPMTLKLIAENGFPVDMDMQLFLVDSTGIVTDSILVPGIIPAGVTDANNIVIVPTVTTIDIPVDDQRKQRMLAVSKLGIRARLNTPSHPALVDFYDHYRLKIKLVADGAYTIR